jgi:hypothetical protein
MFGRFSRGEKSYFRSWRSRYSRRERIETGGIFSPSVVGMEPLWAVETSALATRGLPFGTASPSDLPN